MILHTEKNRTKRHFFDKVQGQLHNRLYDIPSLRDIDEKSVELFFHLGFVPGNSTIFSGVDCLPGGCDIELTTNNWEVKKYHFYKEIIEKEKYLESDIHQLAITGGEIFQEVVSDLYTTNSKVLVPLSGGYDSRAILAALLETTNAENIYSYSFGTPKTLDFEIGAKIARTVGIKHLSFDLTKDSIDESKLLRIAKLTDGNTDLFQPVFLLDIIDKINSDMTIWSGYTGDGLGGSHFNSERRNSKADAINNFIYHASMNALDPDDLRVESKNMIATKSIYQDVLSLHEEVYFANHVERYSVNHVILNNLNYALPFMDDRFTQFMFSINWKFRKDKILYNKIWSNRYPELFSIGLKENYGLSPGLSKNFRKLFKLVDLSLDKFSKNYSRKQINYIDYGKKIQYDKDFLGLIENGIFSLPKEIFQNYKSSLLKILEEHKNGSANNSRFLTTIASLSYIIKANNS